MNINVNRAETSGLNYQNQTQLDKELTITEESDRNNNISDVKDSKETSGDSKMIVKEVPKSSAMEKKYEVFTKKFQMTGQLVDEIR
ncbi:MAG: hypothetical protein K6E13_10970 [Lachnospiraceae bacterium]|nr:hypothetical protein [Lachnospiraceae bacterium]